jgi:hypothetical protein
MGAPIDGQPANPSPSSLVLAHLGQDSVGMSKHTNIIRRLLCGVESLANGKEAVPGEPDENDDDDDDDEVEVRPARCEKGKPKARVDMAPSFHRQRLIESVRQAEFAPQSNVRLGRRFGCLDAVGADWRA